MDYVRGLCALGLMLVSGCAIIAGLDHTYEREEGVGNGPDGSGGSGGSTATVSGGGGGASAGAGGMGGPPPFCDVDDTSLIACYTFNSGFDDESGYKNVNTPGDSLQNGWEGTAAYFSSGEPIVITDEPFWHVDDFTVEMWTKLDTLAGAQYWLYSGERFAMSHTNTEVYCGIVNGQELFYIKSGYILTTGKWTHIACVHKGSVLTLYVDGDMVNQQSGNLTISHTNGNTKIGTHFDETYPLYGLIDNLRIFNVARSAQQICASTGKSDCQPAGSGGAGGAGGVP